MILAILGLAACSSPKVAIEEGKSDPAKPTILIAVLKGAESNSKKDLAALIRKDYGTDYNVIMRSVKKYSDVKDEKYSALVVMDYVRAWLMGNGGLKDFVRRSDNNKTVYFLTSGDSDFQWKREPVRMVTAATPKATASQTYPQLKAALDAILNPH